MNRQSDYKLSFTAGGGLLREESLQVAALYAEAGCWTSAIENARQDNLTQARTARSGERILSEVSSRLKTLTEAQLQLFLKAPRTEQLTLLWLAICKRYLVLREFADEVVRHRFLSLDLTVTRVEFDRFLENKSVWHEEIDRISDSTKLKLSQVAIQMLREAEIISTESIIQPALLSPEVVEVIIADDPSLLQIFPASESDIRGLKR